MRKTIVAYGEILWDILPDGSVLGGAPFNFAYRVHTLNDRARMISRLGRDDLGRQAYEKVLELGLDTSLIQWDEHHPTGTVQVSFDQDHRPDYVIVPEVAYDYLESSEALIQAVAEADVVCFGTLIQRQEQSRKTLAELLEHSADSIKILDINLRKKCFSTETITDSLEVADILKLNETEAGQLARMLAIAETEIPKICEIMLERFELTCCVVTLEERGAFAITSRGEKIYDPGYRVEIVDSLGAGDAFTAGFINKILRDSSLSEASNYGNVLGAIVTTQTGATGPISPDKIISFNTQNIDRIIDPKLEDFIQ